MLFLTNLLIIVGVMAGLVAYVFGVITLAERSRDKWGNKGFDTVFGVLIFLPMIIIHALVMTYGT